MFDITPKRIDKNEIHTLQFPRQPLDHSKEKLNYITKAIRKALKIGNAYKIKIKIVFYDTTGLKEVETTVWNSTTENVVLKNGICIPFHRVVDVK
ncbi:MAG TPA: hypothetical protein DHU89_07145 [Flavobacteriales bacterium]|nr:hypothetical protein [Flavobacteriales bacterium]|tara:strand:- start:3193 stop:3477 length:285 start_codon:yes stop_codon:yes gene_type:complete